MASDNLRSAVPFFRVADMRRSLSFYLQGLGFGLRHKWEVDGQLRWCWVQRGPVALMLQQFPAEGNDSWVPECKVGEGVTICFVCDDAIELFHEVAGRGISASTPVVGNGMWVTSMSDPDGYRLDFESSTDAAEGTALDQSTQTPDRGC